MGKGMRVALFSLLGVFLVACDKESSEQMSIISSETVNNEDGVTFMVGDKELVFPYDFTYSNLISNGYQTEIHEGVSLVTLNDSNMQEIKYTNGMTTSYVTDSYLFSDIDSMYLAGFSYYGDDIKLIDGIDMSDPEIISETETRYTNEDYTVTISKVDDDTVSCNLLCLNEESMFKDKDTELDESGIKEYDVESLFNENGGVAYNSGSMTFQSEFYMQNKMATYIPFNIGFTSDRPRYILGKEGDKTEIIGMYFSEKGDNVSSLTVGNDFTDSIRNLGITVGENENCIKLTSEKSLCDVYVQSESDKIETIVVVNK